MVGTGKPEESKTGSESYPKGHVMPSDIELRAVNYNWAKNTGGDTKKLDNPSLEEHMPGQYYPGGVKSPRIREVASRKTGIHKVKESF